MQEVFGPGGFLERCMQGGIDRAAVGGRLRNTGRRNWRWRMVHDAFETSYHAMVEAGTGTGIDAGYLLPAELQRPAGGDFHGEKSLQDSCSISSTFSSA